jgi:hypothetical protein
MQIVITINPEAASVTSSPAADSAPETTAPPPDLAARAAAAGAINAGPAQLPPGGQAPAANIVMESAAVAGGLSDGQSSPALSAGAASPPGRSDG